MDFIIHEPNVVNTGVLKDYKISKEETEDGNSRFTSRGRFKNEYLVRSFDIRYLPKEKNKDVDYLEGNDTTEVLDCSQTQFTSFNV